MKYIKYVLAAIAVVAVLLIGFKIGDWYRGRDVEKLSAALARSAETVKLSEELYQRQVAVVKDVTVLLNSEREEVALLKKQLDSLGGELLTAQQISLRWKKAYEAAVAAQQTEEPPANPGDPPRKRVDFTGRLGPILATGHTLTDPPEAYLKLEQIDPLVLTMTVIQAPDGTWTSLVASSDKNVDVKVDLAAVNPYILSPKWYQKIWVNVGADFIGDKSGTVSLGYYGDRFSGGIQCFAGQYGSYGCGGFVGARIFK